MAAFTPSAFYGKACDSSDSECDFSGEDTYDPKEAAEIVSDESSESDGDSTESDEETCADAVASSSWTPYLDSDQDFETHRFTVQNPATSSSASKKSAKASKRRGTSRFGRH